jgi:AAA+ ATPase superfamily predicted ATPase
MLTRLWHKLKEAGKNILGRVHDMKNKFELTRKTITDLPVVGELVKEIYDSLPFSKTVTKAYKSGGKILDTANSLANNKPPS